MAASFADLHIKALQVAQECVSLGARIRTITVITGLPAHELSKLFFQQQLSAPRGRPPDSVDWYHSTNLANQVEGCVFVGHFKRLREQGFAPVTALVSAYKHYRAILAGAPRIGFDRAFDLASHFEGRWIAQTRSFDLIACEQCDCEFLTPLGGISSESCPFCKLSRRFSFDQRVQGSFPMRETMTRPMEFTPSGRMPLDLPGR